MDRSVSPAMLHGLAKEPFKRRSDLLACAANHEGVLAASRGGEPGIQEELGALERRGCSNAPSFKSPGKQRPRPLPR